MRDFCVSLVHELDSNSVVSAGDLNTALLEASRCLEIDHPEQAPRVVDGLREEVKHMWQARKDMLAEVPPRMARHIRLYLSGDHQPQDEASLTVRDDRMRGILRAWKHLSSYLRLHKLFRKRGRERKRELFGETLEAAVQAEASGDRQSLYSAIRKLAPKTPRLKTQVRGPQGQLLSQEEENLEFMTYGQSLLTPARTQKSPILMVARSQSLKKS